MHGVWMELKSTVTTSLPWAPHLSYTTLHYFTTVSKCVLGIAVLISLHHPAHHVGNLYHYCKTFPLVDITPLPNCLASAPIFWMYGNFHMWNKWEQQCSYWCLCSSAWHYTPCIAPCVGMYQKLLWGKEEDGYEAGKERGMQRASSLKICRFLSSMMSHVESMIAVD